MNNCPIFLGRSCCKKVDFQFVNKCPEMLQFISEGPYCLYFLSFFFILMFSLIFMKLKSHDCIPDYSDKRSFTEHSLEDFFENTMSNNNPGTCVCVDIAPQFFHDLYRILLIFINMQIRRFYRSKTLQNLSNCINGAIKITTMVILV